MSFYVGQKVVCVDDSPGPYTGLVEPGHLKKGNIYTIRALVIVPIGPYAGTLCLLLEEIVRSVCICGVENWEPPYRAYRFRPLIERKSSTSTGFEILDDIRKRETIDDKPPVKVRT